MENKPVSPRVIADFLTPDRHQAHSKRVEQSLRVLCIDEMTMQRGGPSKLRRLSSFFPGTSQIVRYSSSAAATEALRAGFRERAPRSYEETCNRNPTCGRCRIVSACKRARRLGECGPGGRWRRRWSGPGAVTMVATTAPAITATPKPMTTSPMWGVVIAGLSESTSMGA